MSTGSSGFCTLQRGPEILQNPRGMLAIEYRNARRSSTEPMSDMLRIEPLSIHGTALADARCLGNHGIKIVSAQSRG